jgi:hypothetical protein
MAVARALVGSDRDGLIKTTAKQFGYERTGDHIREALEAALDALLRDGKLIERFGSLSCAD